MNRPLWTRADLIVAAALVGASFLIPPLFLWESGPLLVEIHSEQATRQYGLTPSQLVEARGPLGVTRVVIDGEGGARVLSSPCPLKICVRAGRLERPGQVAACVPNRVAVTLTGEGAGSPQQDDGGVDAIAR